MKSSDESLNTAVDDNVAKRRPASTSGGKKRRRGTSSTKARGSGQQEKKKRSFDDLDKESQPRGHDESEPKKRKATAQAANTTSTDVYAYSGARLSVIAQRSSTGSLDKAMNTQSHQPERMNYEFFDRPQRVPRPLPPILLQATDPNKLPEKLRRMDPDMRIDIFNRKTGKIMSGQDAIQIKDLSQALLMHAEYEPIVPPLVVDATTSSPPRKTAVTRQGRSAPNVRVRQTVNPQNRWEVPNNKGKKVKVTDGPYSNYVGTIDARTPGGWYVLRDVGSKNEKLAFPLVVDPQHVEFLSEGSRTSDAAGDSSSNSKDDNTDDIIPAYDAFLSKHNSDLVQMLRKRIDELDNEESALQESIVHSGAHNESRKKEMMSRLRTVRILKASTQEELNDVEKTPNGRPNEMKHVDTDAKLPAQASDKNMSPKRAVEEKATQSNDPSSEPADEPHTDAVAALTAAKDEAMTNVDK